jgi:tetratricopeptide (TPR) repeat protein
MKPERNDPCPCGSGKKYKKCCSLTEVAAASTARPSQQAESLSQIEMSQLVNLLNDGRYRDLEARTRVLIVKHPDSGFAWKALGLSLSKQGKDALPALQRATELLPNDAEAHNNLSSALRRLGQLDKALASSQRALAIKPSFAEAHNNLGNVLVDMGRHDEAVTSYRRALQIKSQYAEAHNNLGKALLDIEKPDDAAASCRRALALRPQYAEAHNNLGKALLDLEQFEDAAASCRRALELKPDFAEAHNNLANTLLSLGQLDEAVISCRRALEITPDFAEAHNNLANTLLRLDQLDEAVSSCHQALKLKPDFAKTHYILGTALLRLGRLDDAVSSYRRALELKPDFAEAHNNLGRVLRQLGQLDEANSSCRRALEINPDFAEAHSSLGSVLYDLGQLDAAVASHRRALELKPDLTEAFANLSNALRRLGRVDEAEVSCRRALELAPDSASMIAQLASLRIDQGQFDEARELYMRAISLDPDMVDAWSGIVDGRKMTSNDTDWLAQAQRIVEQDLTPRQETSIRFALGKYFDDVKDFEQAWANYHRAKELVKSYSPKYDAHGLIQVTDLNIQVYDRNFLSRTLLNANVSARPVFVVGMPRSGTTLAEQILASHPAVFGAGELPFWNKAGRESLVSARDGLLNEFAPAKLAGEYLALLENLSADALHVVDKMPANFRHLGLMHAALPQARIIHMQRNPVDTCLSIYFQNFNLGHFYANDLEYLAHYYGEYRRVMNHWRSILPAGTILELPYEDLVTDQETWSRKMIEFVGLEWDPRCLDFHQTDRTVITASRWQVKQKISKSSVARWRNYEKFVGPLLHLLE